MERSVWWETEDPIVNSPASQLELMMFSNTFGHLRATPRRLNERIYRTFHNIDNAPFLRHATREKRKSHRHHRQTVTHCNNRRRRKRLKLLYPFLGFCRRSPTRRSRRIVQFYPIVNFLRPPERASLGWCCTIFWRVIMLNVKTGGWDIKKAVYADKQNSDKLWTPLDCCRCCCADS